MVIVGAVFSGVAVKRGLDSGAQVSAQLDRIEKAVSATTQRPSTAKSVPNGPQYHNDSGGFMQLEKKEILRTSDTLLRVGERFQMNYHLFNRGNRPVLDTQSWGMLICLDAKKNPDSRLMTVLRKGIEDAYTKFKGGGPTIGVGQEQWSTAVSEPLTAEQLEGLKKGTYKMYFTVGMAWNNENHEVFYSYFCSWFSDLNSSADLKQAVWHFCN